MYLQIIYLIKIIMATFTHEEIVNHNAKVKDSIAALPKPLGAYQLYCQAMREYWVNLPENDKNKYIEKARQEKTIYEQKKNEILQNAEKAIKQKKIYLKYTTASVPCVGLDNGFNSYNIIGPVGQLEVFTEAEKQKLIERGVPEYCITKYKSVGGKKFNWRAAKKWAVGVYGGSQNHRPSWGSILENYEGRTGKFTEYHNYKGETWTTDY